MFGDNKLYPSRSCYLVGSTFHNGRSYKKNTFSFTKSLELREVMFGVHISLNTNSQ